MVRPLSQDLRDRVIAVVDGGMSCHAAAERFGIAVSSAVRWVRAWRAEGRVTALPQGGDLRSHHVEAYRDVILAAIEAEVDITLVELADLLHSQHGASFAPSTVWRFLDRHDLTFKKKRRTPASRSGPTSPPDARPGSTRSLISTPRT
jgi:transposase